MNDTIFNKYADLLLQVGVNLQPGQNLNITSEPYHWDFVNRVAAKAYDLGARHVEAAVFHPGFGKARVDHSAAEHLDYMPDYQVARYDGFVRDNTALLGIYGSEFPDIFKDIDQKRQAVVQKSRREKLKAFHEATSSGRIPWSLGEVPTPAWSQQVFGDEDEDRLWDLMIPILRLDQDDPVATWWALSETLERRAKALDAHHFCKLHFEAAGTDLTVLLPEKHTWCGGSITNGDGHTFVPNLPTEEVFTSPDYRGTQGRAQVTRPVEVLGHEVHDAWFEFKDGLVTDYGASAGKDRLDTFFEIDARARSLGEIALVDGGSPIFQSGQIFHSILYDENAACHMALGSSYADTYHGGPDLSEDQRYAAGLNQSLLHTDFMIGSEGIQVSGHTLDGGSVPIIQQGNFTPEFA